jgi:asparagine synthase (glutamine-hydrolysing)
VHSLRPGHLLIATTGHLTVRRYFDFDTARRLRFPSFRDYASAFHNRFVAAVRGRLRSPSPVAISVSGGLDSSYIFCVAQRLVREEPGLCPAVLGFNYGGPPGSPSDERRFVDELESAYDVKIERIAERPGFMACAADDVWYSESPRVDGVACMRDTVLSSVRRSGARRFLTGVWGDQLLSDSDYLTDLVRTGSWQLAKQHRQGWRISARRLSIRCARDLVERHAPLSLQSVLRRARRASEGAWRAPWFTPRFRKMLLDRFTADRLPRPAGTSHAWAMYRQVRGGYFLGCMEWNTRIGAVHDLEIAFPYLDSRLVQFLMSIPGEVQSHNGVPRGLMREAMRGVVPDAIIDRRSKGEFTHLTNEGIEHDFAAIHDLLGPDALSVRLGYVDGPVLWPLLEEWEVSIRTAENVVVSDRIINLCGLELLLRRFFSGPSC